MRAQPVPEPSSESRQTSMRISRQTSRRRVLGWGIGAVAASAIPVGPAVAAVSGRSPTEAPADLILRSGTVWTGERAGRPTVPGPPPEAVAVRGRRVVAVGSDEQVLTWAGGGTRVIDLRGAFVMPAFRDQHTHLLEAASAGAPAEAYRPSFSCYDPEAAFEGRRRVGERHLEIKANNSTPVDPCADTAVTDELKQNLLAMQDEVAKQGISAVVEAGLQDLAVWDALVELADEGLLKVRFLVRVGFGCMEEAASRGLRTGVGNEWVRILGVKNYADGWLGPRTAALRQPYADDPYGFPPRGVLFLEQDRADRDVARARELGFNVTTHAIGDRGVATMLTAYERAGVNPADRWALEHVQVVGDDLVERMARGGVIASFQLSFATTDARFARSAIGPRRVREAAYRWDTMRKHGVPLAGGSDFSVEVLDPLWGLQRVVTRQDFDGFPTGGFRKSEALRVDDALRTITVDDAYASAEESERGTIRVGNYADLVVLRENLRKIPAHRIAFATRLMTITNGQIVSEGEVAYPPDEAAACDPYPEEGTRG